MTDAQQRYAEKWAFQHFALEMLSRVEALTEAESEAVRNSFNEDTLIFKFRYCLTFDHNAFFDEDDVRHWTVARSIEELKALGVI